MKKLAYITFLLTFGLVACTGQALTAIPSPVTPTLTHSPSLTPTITIQPTETVVVLSQSQILEAVKQEDYKTLCDGKDLHPTISQSPNGEWAAIPCNPFTKIFRMDGTKSWKVSSSMLSLPDERLNLDLFIHHWSSDQRYIYLRLFSCCLDGPGGIPLHDHALYRLNLATGELTTILEPLTDYLNFYDFTFSPDDNDLVYTRQDIPNKLFIKDLALQTETSILLNRAYSAAGDFFWSDDDKTIVFIGESGAGDAWGFSLLSLNWPSKSLSILLDNDRRLFMPQKWLTKNELLLWSLKDDTYWKFNVITKSMIPAPAPASTP